MRKLLIALLLIPVMGAAQTIHINAGISSSNLNWKVNGYKLDNSRLAGMSFYAGMDYLENHNFNLSSNIGYIQKGASSILFITDGAGNFLYVENARQTFNYISLNTIFEYYIYHTKELRVFVGAGPRVDYLASVGKRLKKSDFNDISYGLIAGAGLKYDQRRYTIGFRADYLPNFSKIYSHSNSSVTDKTYLINVTAGFKLHKK
jgi:hypothetical protein